MQDLSAEVTAINLCTTLSYHVPHDARLCLGNSDLRFREHPRVTRLGP